MLAAAFTNLVVWLLQSELNTALAVTFTLSEQQSLGIIKLLAGRTVFLLVPNLHFMEMNALTPFCPGASVIIFDAKFESSVTR